MPPDLVTKSLNLAILWEGFLEGFAKIPQSEIESSLSKDLEEYRYTETWITTKIQKHGYVLKTSDSF